MLCQTPAPESLVIRTKTIPSILLLTWMTRYLPRYNEILTPDITSEIFDDIYQYDYLQEILWISRKEIRLFFGNDTWELCRDASSLCLHFRGKAAIKLSFYFYFAAEPHVQTSCATKKREKIHLDTIIL